MGQISLSNHPFKNRIASILWYKWTCIFYVFPLLLLWFHWWRDKKGTGLSDKISLNDPSKPKPISSHNRFLNDRSTDQHAGPAPGHNYIDTGFLWNQHCCGDRFVIAIQSFGSHSRSRSSSGCLSASIFLARVSWTSGSLSKRLGHFPGQRHSICTCIGFHLRNER